MPKKYENEKRKPAAGKPYIFSFHHSYFLRPFGSGTGERGQRSASMEIEIDAENPFVNSSFNELKVFHSIEYVYDDLILTLKTE